MRFARKTAVLGMALAAQAVLAVPVAAAGPDGPLVTSATPSYPGPLVNGPAEEAKLHAMATVEDAEMLAAAVVTHVVSVKAAGDEEWRAAVPGWQGAILDRVETADNAMFSQFGINLSIEVYVSWPSHAGSGSVCGWLSDLEGDVPNGSRDVTLGFMGDKSLGNGGCAYLNGSYAIVKRQAPAWDWMATQHEVSHLYNAPDRSGDAHPADLMEDPYGSANIWCTKAGFNDKGTLTNNADKFD